ncbi:hypothetical protein B0H10DRAFT_2245705 [Mycena sp. CBHHK59/15]|nr:hypothetical protein B0H10DRAFT_2245705 [Mycena sp. CBHHK59/15]
MSSKDFVPFTNHRAVFTKIIYSPLSGNGSTIFPAFNAMLNKAQINIKKIIAQLRFIGGTIRTIHDDNTPAISHGDQSIYNQLVLDYYEAPPDDQSLLQYVVATKRGLHCKLFAKCVAKIRSCKEKNDRYRITTALKYGSTKRLVNPGEFIELPITVNDLSSDRLVSDPNDVKEISRRYWTQLYRHDPPPNIPKPWLTTKSVLEIKDRVEADPFIWPRHASITDFQALLR